MIRSHHLAIATALAVSTLTASTAEGFRQPRHGGAPGLVLANGSHTRLTGTVTTRVPRAAEGPWRMWRADVGGRWLALWDEATGIPRRVWGTGVPAPQANSSASAAAAFAEQFLQRHLALLAPGAAPADFELSSNVQHGGSRTVAYRQHHHGLLVVGGQVSFRFKNDRLMLVASDALPAIGATVPLAVVGAATAQARAEAWLQAELGAQGTTTQVEGPVVLPLVGQARVLDAPVVLRVVIETVQPLGRWAVYVDAASGRPLAREQTLRFAEGTVLYDAPVRYPAAGRQDYPARRAAVTVAGTPMVTDDNGTVTFPDGPSVPVVTEPTGTGIYLVNDAGPEAAGTFTLAPGGTVTWSAPTEPQVDAQVSAFTHARIAKDFALQLAPNLAWLGTTLPVKVNIAGSCNAFYNGNGINFLQGDPQCENTARLADVIYHEFGHGLHHHAVILGAGQFESALSEGLSDYYAATITGDPKTSPGFYHSAEPLRDIDPEWGEYEWPYDIHYDPHQTGLIIGGALWDLRKLLVTKLGEEAGAARANELFFQAMRTASDIPTMYPEILAADDDDGDLANGTPNVCEIIDAFARHGLRFVATDLTPLAVEPPEAEGYEVHVTVGGLFDQCPGDQIESAKLRWRLRRNPNQLDTVVMEGGPTEYTGVIPQQIEGDVIHYRVDLEPAIGTPQSFPDNLADPMYELFVGDVAEIYCTDFETDPFAEGWTHGLLEGS
ncbi:MAG: M36 family metallopeptidase, partial [Deltaproteobacteria bacterium]|nr:M36 family metallopeptidase [Deltaproteobacteria bacterium]